jgi:hypothetical protein
MPGLSPDRHIRPQLAAAALLRRFFPTIIGVLSCELPKRRALGFPFLLLEQQAIFSSLWCKRLRLVIAAEIRLLA